MGKKIFCFVMSFFILSFSLIGCSSKGKSTENKTVKIGAVLPMTGDYSSYGQSCKMAMELLIKKTNEKESKSDSKIEIIYEDDESNPEISLALFKKLIEEEKVSAVIGTCTSKGCIAMAPLANEKKIPMITPSATNDKLTKMGKYVFRACYGDLFQGAAMAKYASGDLKSKRAVIIYNIDDEYSKGLAESFSNSFEKSGGIVEAWITYKSLNEDITEKINKLKQSNFDVIVIPDYYETPLKIVDKIRTTGINTPIIGGDGWDSAELIKDGRQYLNNSYFTTHFTIENTSQEVIKFKTDFESLYKKEPDAFSALAYDSLKVLTEAINNSKETKGEKIRDSIEKTEIDGVTGKIKFDDNGEPIKKAIIIKIQDGKKIYIKDITP